MNLYMHSWSKKTWKGQIRHLDIAFFSKLKTRIVRFSTIQRKIA